MVLATRKQSSQTASVADHTTLPPLPGDAEDEARRAEARLRRRILEGAWRQDAADRIAEFFPKTTSTRLGRVDLTRNLLRSLVVELSCRYATPPRRLHDDDRADEAMAGALKGSMMWSSGRRLERYTVGLRESFMRHDYIDGVGLQHRVVTPDLVHATPDPDEPGRPLAIIEAREHELGGKVRWLWHSMDRRDGLYRVLLPHGESRRVEDAEDVTEAIMGDGFDGRLVLVDGEPALPTVLYHAEAGSGHLFNWRELCEVVDATLQGSALWSFWGYLVRDGSIPLRALADGIVKGLAPVERSNATYAQVAYDGTSLLMVGSDGAGGAHALQWDAGADPERMQLAIQQYLVGCAQSAGLSPDDFVANGQAESGYAISLKSEAKRREQRAMTPSFSRGDSESLAYCAALLNRWESAGLPEDGWAPRYEPVGLTPQERETRLAEAQAGIDGGWRSLVDAVLAEHPGMSRDEAKAHLDMVRAERAALAADLMGVGDE
jgi:hypothetical protein